MSTYSATFPSREVRRKEALRRFLNLNRRRRRWKSTVACFFIFGLAILALCPLFSVAEFLVSRGLQGIDKSFFLELPKPVGEVGGGVAHSIVGTVVLVSLGALLGIPWGVGVGIYLSEYGRGRFSSIVRFCADMLASTPSIILGLFVYATVVAPMKRFSALAGGIALAILMVPAIARSTEEILRLVPQSIREAGLALGLVRWKVTLSIVLRAALGGIVTSVILSLARAAGETAPLLFTAFNNRYWHESLDQPISSLPVQIYTYAISPYEDWHRKAWASALVLVGFVFLVNICVRALFYRHTRRSE